MFVSNQNTMATKKTTTETQTMKVGGRDIPVTKSGLPNMVYLSKEEKEVMETFKAQLKKEKKDLRVSELKAALNSLKK
jgi:PHD/YefM family antitoxin component YafN of YafNO toxin-antitoxin module